MEKRDITTAFNDYLKEINSLTEHCIVKGTYGTEDLDFILRFKPDIFVNYVDCFDPSEEFVRRNDEIFVKYFGNKPSYNYTYTGYCAHFF